MLTAAIKGEQADADPYAKKHVPSHTRFLQPDMTPGGLANAFAAATSNNQMLEQVAPANRPQPGTVGMRDFFMLPWNCVYFNASYGNVPWPVMQAQWALQAQCESNPQTWMLEGAAPKLQHVRKLLAHYTGCAQQDLALVENCTSGANAVLRSLDIPAGSTLIHLSTAYGVIKNCMAHCAEEHGAHIVEVEVVFRGNGAAPCGRGGRPLAAAVADAMDAAAARGAPVALACFDHIASCPGVLMPVVELARECRARGVPVMLDGAHVLGQLPVELTELEAEGVCYWISDAHKWLFSPKGSAVLWVTRSRQATVFPAALGAAVRSSRSLASFKASAVAGLTDFEMRFQYTGTRDYTPFAAIEAALHFRQLIGEAAIVSYNHEMALWAQKYLAAAWGTETLVPDEHTCAMGHARLPISNRTAATRLAELLKERYNVHVMLFTLPAAGPAGCETFWVRPCFQIYVSRQHVELLARAVLELAPLANVAELAASWLGRVRARTPPSAAPIDVPTAPAVCTAQEADIYGKSGGFSVSPSIAIRNPFSAAGMMPAGTNPCEPMPSGMASRPLQRVARQMEYMAAGPGGLPCGSPDSVFNCLASPLSSSSRLASSSSLSTMLSRESRTSEEASLHTLQ